MMLRSVGRFVLDWLLLGERVRTVQKKVDKILLNHLPHIQATLSQQAGHCAATCNSFRRELDRVDERVDRIVERETTRDARERNDKECQV